MRTSRFLYDDGVWSCEPEHLTLARALVSRIRGIRQDAEDIEKKLPSVAIEMKKSLVPLNKALAEISSFEGAAKKEET